MQQATITPDTAPSATRPEATEALGVVLIGSALDLVKQTIATHATAQAVEYPATLDHVIDSSPEVQDALAMLGAVVLGHCPANSAFTTLRQAADELARALHWADGEDHEDANVRACRLKILAECAALRLEGAI